MTEKVEKYDPRPTVYGWGSFEKMTDVIEARLSKHDWLVGDSFTMADLMVCTGLQALANFNMHDLTPAQSAFIKRCRDRPAHKSATAHENLATAQADGVELVIAPSGPSDA